MCLSVVFLCVVTSRCWDEYRRRPLECCRSENELPLYVKQSHPIRHLLMTSQQNPFIKWYGELTQVEWLFFALTLFLKYGKWPGESYGCVLSPDYRRQCSPITRIIASWTLSIYIEYNVKKISFALIINATLLWLGVAPQYKRLLLISLLKGKGKFEGSFT